MNERGKKGMCVWSGERESGWKSNQLLLISCRQLVFTQHLFHFFLLFFLYFFNTYYNSMSINFQVKISKGLILSGKEGEGRKKVIYTDFSAFALGFQMRRGKEGGERMGKWWKEGGLWWWGVSETHGIFLLSFSAKERERESSRIEFPSNFRFLPSFLPSTIAVEEQDEKRMVRWWRERKSLFFSKRMSCYLSDLKHLISHFMSLFLFSPWFPSSFWAITLDG